VASTTSAQYKGKRVSVQFEVCLARFAEPGGRPIQILGRTCGGISETFNASEN
jgi:hypothetical protein